MVVLDALVEPVLHAHDAHEPIPQMHLSSAVDTGADAQMRLRARTPAPGGAAGVGRVANQLVRRPGATAAALLDGRLRSGVLKKVRVSTSVVMSVTLLAVLHEQVRAHRGGAAASHSKRYCAVAL